LYTVFAPYSPSYPLCPPPTPFHWFQPTPPNRTCSTLLLSNFEEEKKEETKKMTFLLVSDKGSYIGSFFVIFACMHAL
jgi:hypothetical protein